ncbi:hypothetical protein [Leifsonia sp. 22587]|uniref:glycoside hydrolase family 38 N-terminal domain-containing protein n=1 Tax=Leifsonia sp. 22587 TaxID=3453946 RepID=UPI003F83C6BD
MPSSAVFVPHFHWDREWYEPFQVFRHRLVGAFDLILDVLESDPGFRFTVDGQMAAVEDYLQMRPENRDRVAALVASGQLAVGPWLILLDEFLCSGETIVRNLQSGWASARELGGSMPVGYLPDMFGHVAQMPQILVRAGIEDAALWRGVPGSVEGHAFWWEAPDGSRVRTEYLFDGYDNGLDVLLVPDQIGRALDDYTRQTLTRWGDDPVLAMAGTDHNAPHPDLGRWLQAASTDERPIRIATLQEYLRAHIKDDVSAVVRGELRSHARGNILPGVLSVRLGLKQRMATAERTVREAERALALFAPDRDESPFLALAWRKIIESTAHDSVVGSGTDETVEQVDARLAEAQHAARAVRDGALAAGAAVVPSDAHLVVNTLAVPRTALIEVDAAAPVDGSSLVAVTADRRVRPVQMTSEAPTVLSDEVVEASQLERVLRRIHRRELFGRLIDRYELTPGSLVFHLAEVPATAEFDLLRLRTEVAQAAVEHPGVWRVLTLEEARVTALVPVDVAASGATTFRLVPSDAVAAPHVESVTATPRRLTNGLVAVEVAGDGLLTVTGADGTVLRGVGRLVDGGDRGDSYNYAPPASGVVISEPSSVAIEVVESGPLRARLLITRVYDWPVSLSGDRDVRSEETVPTLVETVVELRQAEPFVRVSVSFLNRSADHRLRLHVPLPEPVAVSASSGQFAVTERGLEAEGGWGEFPLPTFPASEFVSAGAATVLVDHATEYEVVEGGSELAITLLRAIGSISVNIHPLRDEPAATEIAAPGAQDLGVRVENRLAIVPSAAGWRGANAVALAEEFRNDVLVARGTAPVGGALPEAMGGLAVHGRDTLVSSVRRVTLDGRPGVEVRLVAMSDDGATPTLTGEFTEAAQVDLLGRTIAVEEAYGACDLMLGPWEIRTLVLR